MLATSFFSTGESPRKVGTSLLFSVSVLDEDV